MSSPAPQKRYTVYRHRVTCSECKKDIVVDHEYPDVHARTKYIGKKVKFTVSRLRQINRNKVSLAAMKQSVCLNAVKPTPKMLTQVYRTTAVQI